MWSNVEDGTQHCRTHQERQTCPVKSRCWLYRVVLSQLKKHLTLFILPFQPGISHALLCTIQPVLCWHLPKTFYSTIMQFIMVKAQSQHRQLVILILHQCRCSLKTSARCQTCWNVLFIFQFLAISVYLHWQKNKMLFLLAHSSARGWKKINNIIRNLKYSNVYKQ